MGQVGADDGRVQRWEARLRKALLKVFGPADLGPEHRRDPLTGTKWDPAVKRARREARAAQRRARRQG